jgi:hypothetical protein
MDMHLQRIGGRFVVPAVNVVVENFAMHRAARFHHQARQQGVLFRRKSSAAAQPHQAPGDVQAQIADADFVIALVIMTAEQGANARVQLFQGKGLTR